MSDIDRTRMIPLHIADQAVAACDAEIAKLRAENARLKAEVERLTKAGDLLAFHYISLGRKFFPNDPLPSSISDWNRAKEGKPHA
jgi:hypothetical protein